MQPSETRWREKMQEQTYKTKIFDVSLEATLYASVFHMEKFGTGGGIMSQIRQMHQHRFHEIFFVFSGTLTINDENGACDYENCAVMIPPSYNHYCTSNVEEAYCFYFSIDRLQKENKRIYSELESILSDSICSIPLDDTTSFYIKKFAKSVENANADGAAVPLLYLTFQTLFERLLPSSVCQERTPPTSKHSRYIHAIDAFLIKSLNEKPTLEYLASKLYLCPKQISRIIKKEYGCSLSELVKRRRLNAACMLLKHTNLSISEIAFTVGYEYESYFFSLFKKTYGLTPLAYRENNKHK